MTSTSNPANHHREISIKESSRYRWKQTCTTTEIILRYAFYPTSIASNGSTDCTQERWAQAYVFPLQGSAQMRDVLVRTKIRDDGAEYEDVYLRHSWSSHSLGITGCENFRVACTGNAATQWDYYSVFFMVPAFPGARANRSLRPLHDCPPFSGEFIVVRRSHNAKYVLNMRSRDRKKAEAAVTRSVSSVQLLTTACTDCYIPASFTVSWTFPPTNRTTSLSTASTSCKGSESQTCRLCLISISNVVSPLDSNVHVEI